MTTHVHPFVATPLRHVRAREETVTKYNRRTDPLLRVFSSFGPSQGLAYFSPEGPIHRHARTYVRAHARTHGKSTTLRLHASPYRFSLVAAGYFGKGPLVTGYPRTSRQANFLTIVNGAALRSGNSREFRRSSNRTNHGKSLCLIKYMIEIFFFTLLLRIHGHLNNDKSIPNNTFIFYYIFHYTILFFRIYEEYKILNSLLCHKFCFALITKISIDYIFSETAKFRIGVN